MLSPGTAATAPIPESISVSASRRSARILPSWKYQAEDDGIALFPNGKGNPGKSVLFAPKGDDAPCTCQFPTGTAFVGSSTSGAGISVRTQYPLMTSFVVNVGMPVFWSRCRRALCCIIAVMPFCRAAGGPWFGDKNGAPAFSRPFVPPLALLLPFVLAFCASTVAIMATIRKIACMARGSFRICLSPEETSRFVASHARNP